MRVFAHLFRFGGLLALLMFLVPGAVNTLARPADVPGVTGGPFGSSTQVGVFSVLNGKVVQAGSVDIEFPPAPSGLSEVETVVEESASNNIRSKGLTALCPEGKKVLGGGVNLNFDFPAGGPTIFPVAIQHTIPYGDSGWYGSANAMPDIVPDARWGMRVYAICAGEN